MAKCKSGKCGCKARVVSNVVQNMQGNSCIDVCANPICESPKVLSLMAPLIYDEIGINLCTSFALGTDISTTYPTATSATARVLNTSYTYGDGNVVIETITGRPNCYVVTLSNLSVEFAVNLYDENCRLLTTLYPTAVYLPPATTDATYDEDTNPTSVELEIFAPYGISYEAGAAGAAPTPNINYVGFLGSNNYIRQGLNLYAMAKVLGLDTDDDTITVGLTLVLQSLYFAGYNVESAGKINTPKGSLIPPDNSSCLRFVAGDLLNLAIKPLELGPPLCEEQYKESCTVPCTSWCGAGSGAGDDTTVLPGIGATTAAGGNTGTTETTGNTGDTEG
ncbi:MAG: hypothetical protein NC092_12255 [Butyrivibrio sp.]|nr:hypothetical protein [Muribaculum sp.]MCM1553449.1 hypothetical protein [Butyrivibrio sp.]